MICSVHQPQKLFAHLIDHVTGTLVTHDGLATQVLRVATVSRRLKNGGEVPEHCRAGSKVSDPAEFERRRSAKVEGSARRIWVDTRSFLVVGHNGPAERTIRRYIALEETSTELAIVERAESVVGGRCFCWAIHARCIASYYLSRRERN